MSPSQAGARQGEGDFEAWYRSAHPRMLAALVAYGASVEDAEDATNEAFARALVRWSRVAELTSPSGWAFVVARNLLRRSARRRTMEASRTRALSPEGGHQGIDPAELATAAADVAAHLLLLSPRERTVVILHHGFDMSQEDVATLLRLKRSTISSTLTNARRRLLEESSYGKPVSDAGKNDLSNPVTHDSSHRHIRLNVPRRRTHVR
ncbi:MAG: RNA polymerase sigma factor [Acidimicrobiales bacterium]